MTGEYMETREAKTSGKEISAWTALGDLGARHMRRAIAKRRENRKQNPEEKNFSLWTEHTPAVEELIAYVKSVTEEGSESYIPPAERLAVTDMDGTLFCETDPTYFDFMLLVYRVLEDPNYKDRATERERTAVQNILSFIDTGVMVPDLEVEVGRCIASSFSGLTVAEFTEYVRARGEAPARGYDGMKAGEAFFRPMLQVMDYLQDNGFSVYICSGTDRMVIRSIVGGEMDIAPRQIIGTDETIVARDQGKTKDSEYFYAADDELVLGGELLNKNLQMSKVSLIAQEIGQQPVLCFGNSTGDTSMANYVTGDNPHPARVFMLLCDDTVRESGKPEKAEKMRKLCRENGWIPISMRDDWTTVFGPGVTKKAAQDPLPEA